LNVGSPATQDDQFDTLMQEAYYMNLELLTSEFILVEKLMNLMASKIMVLKEQKTGPSSKYFAKRDFHDFFTILIDSVHMNILDSLHTDQGL